MSIPRPRPGILDIAPYVGGESRTVPNPVLGRPIRLASNEGALGVSPAAAGAYQSLAGDLHRYPDGASSALRTAIGRRYSLDPARIVCGAGSDEIISLLINAYAGPGDEVLHSAHGFLMYAISARAAGATPVRAPENRLCADVDALLARVTPRTRLVFLANPNNPTGSFLTPDELERLHRGLPGSVILVIDSAYAEYIARNDYSSGAELVERADNVVMTRTFSKIYGLAALRLGWGYFPPAIADALNRVRGPFNVTAAAQAAAVAALDDIAFIDTSRAHNDTWRAWTADRLGDLGLTVHPSIANFLLVDLNTATRADNLRDHLKRNGILVRQMGAYGLPACLRLSIGTEAEMRAVVDEVAHFVSAPSQHDAA